MKRRNHRVEIISQGEGVRAIDFVYRDIGERKKSDFDRDAILRKAEGKCYLCGIRVDNRSYSWEVEHVIPRSRGGSDDISNLMPACVECNRWKLAYTEDEFRDYHWAYLQARKRFIAELRRLGYDV